MGSGLNPKHQQHNNHLHVHGLRKRIHSNRTGWDEIICLFLHSPKWQEQQAFTTSLSSRNSALVFSKIIPSYYGHFFMALSSVEVPSFATSCVEIHGKDHQLSTKYILSTTLQGIVEHFENLRHPNVWWKPLLRHAFSIATSGAPWGTGWRFKWNLDLVELWNKYLWFKNFDDVPATPWSNIEVLRPIFKFQLTVQLHRYATSH